MARRCATALLRAAACSLLLRAAVSIAAAVRRAAGSAARAAARSAAKSSAWRVSGAQHQQLCWRHGWQRRNGVAASKAINRKRKPSGVAKAAIIGGISWRSSSVMAKWQSKAEMTAWRLGVSIWPEMHQ
jgi:hypothetical protein